MLGDVVIQRIRVTWPADARGARDANLRRGLSDARHLPESPPGEPVVVHDVVAAHETGYRFSERMRFGADATAEASPRLETTERGVTVHVHPRWAVYPWHERPSRLFTLAPGEIGIYRANFRFRGWCPCSAEWWYEDWTIRVANAPNRPDLFRATTPRHVADRRVQLYGGRVRRTAG